MTHAPAPNRILPAFALSSRAEALAAIAGVPTGGVIATDCDNTLWGADVGDDLVRLAVARPALFGGVTVDFAAYLAHLEVDYEAACLSSAALLRAAPDRGAVRAGLATYLHDIMAPRRWLIDALLAAGKRGVSLVAVSASAREAVDVGLAICGVADKFGVIAVDCTADGFVSPWPIGFGKAAALQQSTWPRPNLAIGDSTWDGPMLAYATRGVRVARAVDEAAEGAGESGRNAGPAA